MNVTRNSTSTIESGGSEIALGITLGLLASVGINVGNNMQALGLSQQAESGAEKASLPHNPLNRDRRDP